MFPVYPHCGSDGTGLGVAVSVRLAVQPMTSDSIKERKRRQTFVWSNGLVFSALACHSLGLGLMLRTEVCPSSLSITYPSPGYLHSIVVDLNWTKYTHTLSGIQFNDEARDDLNT